MPMPRQLADAQPRRRQRPSQPRTVLEELPAIDARWLARKKLLPRDHSTHRYSLDFLNPVIRWLTLSPRCAEFVLTNGTTQLVGITWLRVGGMCQSARAAFECPNCGHRCFKLFYYQGRFSGCCRCIGVPYASQQRSTKNRPRLQAARLRLFLSALPDNTKPPARPAYMSRRVYARFLNRLQKLEAKARGQRRRKPITKQLSLRVLRPIGAYDSECYYALD
jgi:hypothetical protein